MNIFLHIGEQEESVVNVKVMQNGVPFADIGAKDTEEAKGLLDEAQKQAIEALKDFKPTNTPPKEEKPAERPKNALETFDLEEYEKTTHGKRFIASVENAIEFYLNMNDYSTPIKDLLYLAKRYNNNLVNGYVDIAALEYRRGYNKALKELKKQVPPV